MGMSMNKIACASLVFLFFATSCFSQLPQIPAASIRRDVQVPSARATYIRDSLANLFQRYIRLDPANPSKLELQLSSGRATFEFRSAENLLRIEGPAALTDDIANLVTTFVGLRPEEGVRVVPLHDNGQSSLTKFTFAKAKRDNPMRLASTQQELGAPQSPPTTDPSSPQPNGALPGQGKPPTSLPLPQFEGVQIEMLPEIDAIILRGRDQQLTDLTEIIKKLDEASRLTRPEIEVVPLQHAGSGAIAKLIIAIQEKLTGSIQGRVSVSPLGKPNSLLLIGWGEAVAATKELITKLDQPTTPDAQFEVIQLQHSSATDLQTQLRAFFLSREGLAPVIQSMVDSRTNAIIVHAPPRDLLEIRLDLVASEQVLFGQVPNIAGRYGLIE